MAERLSDEHELRKLVERYFHALDQRDMESIGECFAINALASYNGGDVTYEGRETIVREFAFINSFPTSIHVLANASIDPESREGVVYAVAYLKTVQEDGPARMLVRGLRYEDRYVQEDEQWRFQSRDHFPLWQYDADFVAPWIPGRT